MDVAQKTRVEELTDWLAARHGIAHTAEAKRAGYSAHHISAAVERRVARRVRRSWLVAADCSEEFVTAATVGGRLTCVSAARRIGLWTPTIDATHVAVAHSASRLPADGLVLHRATAPVPLPRTEAVEDIVNVLFHVARCLPQIDALAIWESAIRKRLIDAHVLAGVKWASTRARELAHVALTLSDSGIESAFVALMRSIGVAVRQQVWIDGHPVDALIGDRLVVQLDGFAHHQGRDRRRDLRADARLVLRGYTVIRFDYQQVLFDPAHVIGTIRLALAQKLHERR